MTRFFLSPLAATLLVLGFVCTASPVFKIRSSGITIPTTTRIKATGPGTLVQQEKKRAKALIRRGKAEAVFEAGLSEDDGTSIPMTNTALIYTLDVQVGDPGTSYNLAVDTGSSMTWVGNKKEYKPTGTSTGPGKTVSVTYGESSFSGKTFIDKVDLGGELVIDAQTIGVASQSQVLDENVDGILGLGPTSLTSHYFSSREEVSTVLDNLAKAGTIPVNSIGISFVPTIQESDQNGELTFGGADSSKFTGDITFVPITSTHPASEYWGIDQMITYGSDGTPILNGAGVIDTGSTFTFIATDAFQAYRQAVDGTPDDATGLLRIQDPSLLQPLFFKIGDSTFEFTARAQQWPKELNHVIDGESDATYLVVADLGTNSGEGLDFINGYTWLEHFYLVLDADHKQVGIANTNN